jgi:imidazolonepropionase-like amidohydrolase
MKLQTYKTLTKLLLLILFLSIGIEAQERNSTVVFHNVTLIDMTSEQPKPNMTVIVKGNHIAKIGKNLKISENAEVIDASGKFLIPGLWDMHVHIFSNVDAPGTNNKDKYFPLLIANGVTGVREMFTDPDDIRLVRQWQSEIDAGKMTGPRIFVGSSIVDGVPVVHKNLLGVATPDEARQAVRMLKEAGAGFIKVYENLFRESYYAIADEAKKLNIPFVGHVPNSVTPVEASTAGQKSIEHLTRMSIACSSNEEKFKSLKNEEWTPALRAQLMEAYSEQKCREVSAVFVKNRTWHSPTTVVLRSRLLSEEESFTKDSRLRYIPASEERGWLKFTENFRPANRKNREALFRKDLEILKVMHQSGVPVLAGTDLGNPFIFAGFSLHDELETFVQQAGLKPFDALQTATINPARYLGMEKSHGTIAKGKVADLILLDANPLTDISNTRKINAVVVNGRLLKRQDLDEMLNKVAEIVKQ